MPEILLVVVYIFIFLTFLAAIVLFFALVLKRKPRNDISLFSVNYQQDLSGNEADYFQYIRFDAEKNAIVLKQSQAFKKCVVTLITKKGSAHSLRKFNINYAEGDMFAGIALPSPVDEFKVVLESVDGVVKKHDPVDTYKKMNIAYAAIVGGIFAIMALLFVSYYNLLDDGMTEGFGILYGLVLLAVIYIAVIIGGFILGENLSKKGKF